MNENTSKLKSKILKESVESLTEALKETYGEKIPDSKVREVERIVGAHVDTKIRNYYKKDLTHTKEEMGTVIGYLSDGAPRRSKAERIFEEILKKEDWHIIPQYDIGPYTADFLINSFLVVEIDGPIHNNQTKYDDRRDKYMERLGYQVLRVPIWLLSMSQDGVVESIREIIEGSKSVNAN